MQVTSVNPDHSELSSVKSEGVKQEVTHKYSLITAVSAFVVLLFVVACHVIYGQQTCRCPLQE